MMNTAELKEFFVGNNYSEKQHVLLHITKPEKPEEKEKGHFFALAETRNGKSRDIETLQNLISEMELVYYGENDKDYKTNFEHTLRVINKNNEFDSIKSLDIDFIVGIIRGANISFTYRGLPHLALFYVSHNTLRHTKIIEHTSNQKSAEEIFTTVLDGKLTYENYFYVATNSVNKIFSDERVQKLLLSRELDQVISHIQKVLESLNSEESFGGLIGRISLLVPTKKENITEQPISPNASVMNLIASEKNANETLSPSILSKTGSGIKNLFSPPHFDKNDDQIDSPVSKKTAPNSSIFNTILVIFGEALVITSLAIFRIAKFIVFFIYNLVSNIILFITNSSKRRTIITEVKTIFEHKKLYFQNLSTWRKFILFLLLLLIILFIGSISYLKIKADNEARAIAYGKAVQDIINKQVEAESSLIYGNETKAFNILQETDKLISELPKKTDEQNRKSQDLVASNEEILKKLEKLQTIKPTLIAELPINSAHKIEKINNLLIAYGEESDIFYEINLDTKIVSTHEHSETFNLKKSAVPKENDKIIFINGNNEIAEYNEETTALSPKEINFPVDNVTIGALFVYNQRLYTIDTNSRQIYKHDKIQTGYSKGEKWLKEANTVLKDAIDLAIDSDLYALLSTGKIEKFSAGVRQEFDIKLLGSNFIEPVELWTYSDIDKIFVLDKGQKRLIVLDKQGALVNQFTADEWSNPESMSVDTQHKKIFILDSGRVYSLPI